MKVHLRFLLLYSIACGVLTFSCDADDDSLDAKLVVPTSYSEFDDAYYTGQLERLAMLTELKAYAKTAHDGAALDSSRLAAMYLNDAGAGFQGSYEKNLGSKTFELHRDRFYNYFGQLDRLSVIGAAATANAAGLHTTLDQENTYLLADNGVEYLQVVEKGLMAACFYYQAHSVYLSDQRMRADNTEPAFGASTARAHYFDEAFGYFGVPPDFPTDTDGVKFWGDYCNDRDRLLGTNTIMESFLTGRAAIVAGDESAQSAAVNSIKQRWELTAAGSAIHYLNLALLHAPDPARRAHDLTEAIAFAQAIGYGDGGSLGLQRIDELVETLAGSATWPLMNLWTVTDSAIETFRDELAAATGLVAEKDLL